MIKPNGTRVALTLVERAEKTSSGLYLPGGGSDKITEGIVASVGAGKMNLLGNLETSPFNVGDKVLFNKNATVPYTYEGTDYYIAESADIYATL